MAGNPVYPFSIVSGIALDIGMAWPHGPKVVGFSPTAEIPHKVMASLEG